MLQPLEMLPTMRHIPVDVYETIRSMTGLGCIGGIERRVFHAERVEDVLLDEVNIRDTSQGGDYMRKRDVVVIIVLSIVSQLGRRFQMAESDDDILGHRSATKVIHDLTSETMAHLLLSSCRGMPERIALACQRDIR